MNINIYGMWGSENFEQFYSACIAIHLGCLAFISPKLLEVINQLQNISGLLVKYFNCSLPISFFSIYVYFISFCLIFSCIPLFLNNIQDSWILPSIIFVVISVVFSVFLLLRMNAFHNNTLSQLLKYKYKTPGSKETR